ncbi:MAG: type II toxin-antitoxin system RelE/ParE family toxin [bacterium]|nr:type II toxin-antitoxin system RelE/ParE family toxin [bacterium]
MSTRYSLRIARAAQNDLAELDRKIASRIIDKLEFFALQEAPLRFAVKLNDFKYGTYRFRIGDYRAIFDVDAGGDIYILMILRVKHRKEAYRV